MPDAARLIAALSLAALAFILSQQIMAQMPERSDFGYFVWINLGIAIIIGWLVTGPRAGRGVTTAINNGLSGAVLIVLWALFFHACTEMFRKAVDNWYKDAMDALVAIFELMLRYGTLLLDPAVLITLAVGGVLSGLLTELAWRTWR